MAGTWTTLSNLPPNYEIKEKFEVIEVQKRLLDLQKQVPDIVDQKLIREEFDIFGRYQEEWLQNVRALAMQLDQVQQDLERTFIKPEERPDVGPPPPEIGSVEPRKISPAEAQKAQIKRAYNDGRKEQAFSKEADDFRKKVHNLSKQGGGMQSAKKGARPRKK